MRHVLRLLAVALPIVVCSATAWAADTQVGPGTGIGGTALDTSGGTRLNVDRTDPITFTTPGTYTVTTFSYDAGQTGNVQPFLVSGSPSNTVLSVGDNVTVTGANQGINTLPFSTITSNFYVPVGGLTLYAGINNNAREQPGV